MTVEPDIEGHSLQNGRSFGCVRVLNGYLLITAAGSTIVAISLSHHISEIDIPSPVVDKCKQQLKEYFSGLRQTFTVPCRITGCTPFQKAVVANLLSVPYGTTISYSELAARAGHSSAARAVGNALSANPLPVLFPCHRIICADGSIGGFGLGVDVKKYLLDLECSKG